jgi:hypothetical protein
MLKKFLPLALATTATAACAYPSISDIKNPPALTVEPVVGMVDAKKVVEIEVEEKSWKCPGCNFNEKYVLEKLQEKTRISDRNALATIMGNIKSESIG